MLINTHFFLKEPPRIKNKNSGPSKSNSVIEEHGKEKQKEIEAKAEDQDEDNYVDVPTIFGDQLSIKVCMTMSFELVPCPLSLSLSRIIG